MLRSCQFTWSVFIYKTDSDDTKKEQRCCCNAKWISRFHAFSEVEKYNHCESFSENEANLLKDYSFASSSFDNIIIDKRVAKLYLDPNAKKDSGCAEKRYTW